MKIKIIVVVLALLFSTIFLFFNIDYPYRENVLYSQRDVKNYNENQVGSSNLINRNEASDDSKIYVNLYKNDSNSESYYWNISWSRPNLSCGVEINTINREINDIYVNKYINKDINNNPEISTNLSKSEILEIVRDLVTALGFDLDSYNLSVSDVNNYNYNYKVCTFTKKNDPSDKFVIDIYSKNKFITRYRRNPSKEI